MNSAARASRPAIDMDTTEAEVHGRLKQWAAFNHQGQRFGRSHVAAWADASVVPAVELGSGRDDPRVHAAELQSRLPPSPDLETIGFPLLRG